MKFIFYTLIFCNIIYQSSYALIQSVEYHPENNNITFIYKSNEQHVNIPMLLTIVKNNLALINQQLNILHAIIQLVQNNITTQNLEIPEISPIDNSNNNQIKDDINIQFENLTDDQIIDSQPINNQEITATRSIDFDAVKEFVEQEDKKKDEDTDKKKIKDKKIKTSQDK